MLRRAMLVVALSVVTLLALAGCTEGEVKKKRILGDQPQLLVVTDGGKERWVNVSIGKYRSCSKGEQWPECGGGYDGAAEPRPTEEDDRVVVTVEVSATRRGFLVSYSCPGKEINREERTAEFHQRCLLRKGQRVTVVATANGTAFDCRMFTHGRLREVDFNAGVNSVRCTYQHK